VVHALGFHASYRCRHAGVCCTSGWAIPVEAPLYRSLQVALEWGQLHVEGATHGPDVFEGVDDLPHGEPVVLRRRSNGACVFFEPQRGNLCAIQRQMDHSHLPSACRHFPRVVLSDPRGTFVTLSHVCPTAARMLLDGGPATVVTSGSVIDTHAVGVWEGLDARDELPPLVRPGVLWDWDAWDLWERMAVALLARDGQSPEQALGALRTRVNTLVAWRPTDDPLSDTVRAAFDAITSAAALELPLDALTTLESLVWESVPAERGPRPVSAAAPAEVPGWQLWHAAIGRYLAARAFGNWIGCYGQGLTTWYNSIVAAYAVLRLAAGRLTVGRGTALDAAMLVEALGEADRLLVHLASAPELAEILDDWEAPG
jgi:Fe-S-cluster containining protein